jgi:glyoxalase family protein
MHLLGLHHITAIAGNARRNVDFYTRVLGLRFVKKTVNFDDPGTYHLYYGDATASPGTLLTFFLWDGLPRGRSGSGMATAVAYSVPADALDFWRARLLAAGVAVTGPAARFGEKVLAFTDPDGLPLELVAAGEPDARVPAPHPDIPTAKAIRGFHGVTLATTASAASAGVLANDMGYRLVRREGTRTRYTVGAGGPGTYVDLVDDPGLPRGRNGLGTVHHVAFRTPNDPSQEEARGALAGRGLNVSPVVDRCYFHSIYYREPGGVLFEIATDGPGFAVDEPLEQLGRSLRLPPWYESRRAEIEAHLPPLE